MYTQELVVLIFKFFLKFLNQDQLFEVLQEIVLLVVISDQTPAILVFFVYLHRRDQKYQKYNPQDYANQAPYIRHNDFAARAAM